MAKKPSPSKQQAPSATFEQSMAELESIIDRIESGEIGLEESISAYERGIGLVERCRAVLGEAEQKVEELTARLDAPDASQPTNDRAGEP